MMILTEMPKSTLHTLQEPRISSHFLFQGSSSQAYSPDSPVSLLHRWSVLSCSRLLQTPPLSWSFKAFSFSNSFLLTFLCLLTCTHYKPTGRINSHHQSHPNHQDRTWTVYIDSKYAFHILLTHLAIWKEWGFLNTKVNSITNSSYIHNLFKASL